MLLPYYGPAILNPEEGELRKSNMFFDFGIKIHRNIVLNGATLQLYLGVKNILNSFQNDFDLGIDRDPAYIYGPTMPRTIYFGVKIGNAINF
jgi:outer membrane receptor for ferrienterochelin and colicins